MAGKPLHGRETKQGLKDDPKFSKEHGGVLQATGILATPEEVPRILENIFSKSLCTWTT